MLAKGASNSDQAITSFTRPPGVSSLTFTNHDHSRPGMNQSSPSRATIAPARRRVADQLRPKVPKLARLMDDAEADVAGLHDLPGCASDQAALDGCDGQDLPGVLC